jgi:hypothetical protein
MVTTRSLRRELVQWVSFRDRPPTPERARSTRVLRKWNSLRDSMASGYTIDWIASLDPPVLAEIRKLWLTKRYL